jgi:hemolysin III
MTWNRYLKWKEPVNAWTHALTALAGVVGLVFLIVFTAQSPGKLASMIIYGASVIVLFAASAIYHAVHTTPKKELLLKKIDHISIFLLIAGTYTPVLAFGLTGAWRITMLALVWGIAMLGILMKVFFINVPRSWSTVLYVALGWIAVIPFVKLVHAYPPGAMWFMIGGGIAYTIGAVIYATKKPDPFPGKFGFHEIFHLWVTAGSALHFVMILRYIAL